MRELTTNEIDQVSGGELNLGHIATGVGVLAFGATILATAGLASVPFSLVGAATLGEGVIIGTAMTAGAVGGGFIGSGLAGADSGGLKEKDS